MKFSQETGQSPKRGSFTMFAASCEETGCTWKSTSLTEAVIASAAKSHEKAHQRGLI